MACAALFAVLVPNLRAQAVHLGVQGSWGSHHTNLGIGGRIILPSDVVAAVLDLDQTDPELNAVASFDYFVAPTGVLVDYWEVNGNVTGDLPLDAVGLYVGFGLNVAHVATESGGVSVSDIKLGVNVLGGVKFWSRTSTVAPALRVRSRKSRVFPFLEVRVERGGGAIIVLSGGIVF